MTIGSAGGVTTAATSAATSTAATTGTSDSTAAKSEAAQLSTPNLFLKLLMVELEHQNPTNPTTPSSMLQQTAMLSQVEAINSMKTAITQQQRYSETNDATSLIGKQVTATIGSRTVTGSVTDVSLTSTGTPTIEVGGTTVPLSAVTQVSTVPSITAAAATAPTAASNTTIA